MANELLPGQVRVGHLIDGVAETPFQAATLTFDASTGVELAVPFVHGQQQFEHVAKWFNDRELPAALLFRDNLGTVTLTGLQFSGFSGFDVVLGTARPDIAFFGRPRGLKDNYDVRALSSTLDGIQELAGFKPVSGSREETGSGWRYVVTVDPNEEIKWRHGGFTFAIKSAAPWTQNGNESFHARPEPFIKTSTHAGADVDAHISAQWPFRALLVLAHGAPLHWRRHWAEDYQFAEGSMGGTAEVVFRRTVRDAQKDTPDRGDLVLPAFRLSDIGSRGLRRWCALYDDEVFRRAIEPAVEVVNGISPFLEAQVMMIALALDAMGYYRDENRASGVAMWRQIRRCLEVSGADWRRIGDEEGIAKLIANTNNDLKHPDRASRPDGVQLRLVADLGVMLMRLQLFDLLGIPKKSRGAFLTSRDWNFLVAAFERNGRFVQADGTLQVRTSS
jgi:hypothetical protein